MSLIIYLRVSLIKLQVILKLTIELKKNGRVKKMYLQVLKPFYFQVKTFQASFIQNVSQLLYLQQSNLRRHDIQHNDTQHYDIRHNDIQ